MRHRLAGGARFGNDVEASLGGVDYVEQVSHSDGIDVVLHVKFGAFSHRFGEVVIVKMAERVKRHDGAEGAAADPEHDEILKFSAHVSRRGRNVGDDLFLIVRKLRPTHVKVVPAPVFLHVIEGRSGGRIVGSQLLGREALVAEKFFGHVVVV